MMFLREVPSTRMLYCAEHAMARYRLLVNAFLQDIQTLFFVRLRARRRPYRPPGAPGERRNIKAVAHIEIDVGDELHGLFEIFSRGFCRGSRR